MKQAPTVFNALVNTLRPRQNDCHFTAYIFNCIFFQWKLLYLDLISLKYVPSGTNIKMPALIKIIACCRPGDKPLSEPMMVFLTHICVTQPQWVNSSRLSDMYAIMNCHHWHRWCLVTCGMPSYYQNQFWFITTWILNNKFQWNFIQNATNFIQKMNSKCCLQNVSAYKVYYHCVILY